MVVLLPGSLHSDRRSVLLNHSLIFLVSSLGCGGQVSGSTPVFSLCFPVFHVRINEATALVGVGTDSVVVQVITL